MLLKDPIAYLIRDHDHIVEQLTSCSIDELTRLHACLLLNNLQMNRLIGNGDISKKEKEQLHKKLYSMNKPI